MAQSARFTAIALKIGIWSMHFVAMLTLSLPIRLAVISKHEVTAFFINKQDAFFKKLTKYIATSRFRLVLVFQFVKI
jgi:hypothetical protein